MLGAELHREERDLLVEHLVASQVERFNLHVSLQGVSQSSTACGADLEYRPGVAHI